jgi:octaprenyl-diphosphate synthase
LRPLARPTVELDAIASLVQDDLQQVERLLIEGLRSVAMQIPEVGDHTFASGGKRLRPLLVLLTARLCGYQGPRAIQIGVAAEYMHSASLLHDDVVDKAEVRRGRPSVAARFGERLAILVGDFIYARASQMLVEDGNLEILGLYSDALKQMSEGEVLQLSQSFDPDVSESVYMDVIGRKTASLLAAAAASGAILGGVTRAEGRAIHEYGNEVGLAFQLVDDALDYMGTSDQLGKLPLQDLREGKVTLPLLATLKRCSVAEREMIISVLKSLAQGRSDVDHGDVGRVAEAVARYQGAEFTLERARQRATAARRKIETFAVCKARDALLDLTEFVVQRQN